MASRQRIETFLEVSRSQALVDGLAKPPLDLEEFTAILRAQGCEEEDIAKAIDRSKAFNDRMAQRVNDFVFTFFSDAFTDEEMRDLIVLYNLSLMQKLLDVSDALAEHLQSLIGEVTQDFNAETFAEDLLQSIPPDTKGS